ncbi:MAG: PEGA domain-containing protein [Thermoplasmatales archaeon]|nr:PEGA domain-containing protein [Thermoplasmatales archaeon]
MLSSGFVYGIYAYGNATGPSNNEVKDHSYFQTSNDIVSVAGNDVSGYRQQSSPTLDQPVSASSDVGTSNSNAAVWLGSVNGSYLQPIYVPVYSSDLGYFDNLTQTLSYDPSILSFNGTINDVASWNVTFSYSTPVPGIVKVRGVGVFKPVYPQTILYYLDFSFNFKGQVVTNVSLDSTLLGDSAYPSTSHASLRLVRGWTNLGPSNISAPGEVPTGGAGTVPAIGYSPKNLSVIYVGSGRGGPWQGNLYQGADVSGFGGMFKSLNGGQTWASIDLGLNSNPVNAIVVNPINPEEVVVATGGLNSIVGGGIYKSVNGGLSWQETYPMGGNNFVYENGILYAASFHSILYSKNFGASWEVVHSFSSIVTTLGVSGNGSYLYAGIYFPNPDVQILISKNRGASFSEVADFSGYYTVSQIILDPTNNSNLWALVHHGYTNNTSLYSSQNYGMNWKGVNDSAVGINIEQVASISSGSFREAPQAISYDPINGSIIYVLGPGYTYKSTDGGKHFLMLNSYWGSPNGGQDNRVISIDPLNDNIIFIGSDQGLISTYNGGKTWTGLNNRSSNMLYDVAADGSYIFTTAQDWAPLFSNNYGKTWYQTQDSEEGFVAVDPYNSSIVIHVPPWNNPVYVSNDGGNSFFQSNVNETSLFVQARDTPDAVAFGPRTIYLYGKTGIFYSNDSGDSFSLILGSPYDYLNGGGTIAVSPSNPNIIYASNWNKLYVSHNYGFNWTVVNTLLPTGSGQVGSIAIDPLNSSIIYFDIYHGDTSDTVYKSFNGGRTYEYANMSSQDIFAAPPYVNYYDYKGTLFLVYVSGNGTYISTNQGKTWENVNYNVITSVVSSFYLSQNGSAYISTYGNGVWYDPTLFDLNFTYNSPVLTGYLPTNEYLVINGIKLNVTGYFLTRLNIGNNSIYVSTQGREVFLYGSPGGVYFENFSSVSPKSYGITFIENGLTNGTSWSVTLNGTTESSTGNITFLEPNGTYTFQILPASGLTASPSSGTISVTGKNVSETAHFTPSALRVYSVTFYQTGLPEGISWSVALNGTTNTSVPSISFSVPNGTYSYSVASKPGYNETPSSGSVTVNGHNVSLQVIFMRNNDGYFVPTVIPEVASLYVDGTLYQRAGILIGLPAGNGNGSVEEFFNISLPPGTYQVKVTAPGYRNYTTTITIASPLTSLHPDYILEKISKPPSSLLLEVAVIAVVIVVIAAITTVILLGRRKR